MSRPMADIPHRTLGANYWKLWIASVISNFGDGVALIAYPWLASAVTRRPYRSHWSESLLASPG
ncbi:MAG: hypothetical protein ACR2ME_04200 [Acidimicrobiia bacterium]